MKIKANRSTLTGLKLLILVSLISPALAGTEAQPPARYAQAGPQVSPAPGPYGTGSAQRPGARGMGPGQGPGGYGMGRPGRMGGPDWGPGEMPGRGMMGGPDWGPGEMPGRGMMGGPDWGPGEMPGPGMMGGPDWAAGEMPGPEVRREPQGGAGGMDDPGMMGGPATAMLDVISRLDLTADQRAELDAIRNDLSKREKELLDKIAVAAERLQKLQREHIDADQSLNDLNGHLATANMDAANRAEELLTVEQRQRLISGGAHVMMPEQVQ